MSTKWFSYHLRLTHRPLFSIYIVSTSYILFFYSISTWPTFCKCAQNNHIFFQVDPRSNKWTTHLLALSALSFSMHPPPLLSHPAYIFHPNIPHHPQICPMRSSTQKYKESDGFCMKYIWAMVWRACLFFSPPSPKRLHVCESNMAGVWPDKKHIQSSSFYKQTLHRFSRKKANVQ